MEFATSWEECGQRSARRAEQWMDDVPRERTRREVRVRTRLARLIDEPDALGLIISVTDDVVRTRSPRAAARSLRDAVSRGGRRGFSWVDWRSLQAVSYAAHVVPRVAQAAVVWRLRNLTREVIGTTDEQRLRRVVERRREEGIRLNINVLGEAVLGPREAGGRMDRAVAMMRRPYVDYVSVKLSSLVAHLDYYDPDGSSERLADALRRLLREASHQGVFVNVDMEEFRDLRVTMNAYRRVVLEPEMKRMPVGIVVQAYLPEAHDLVEEIVSLATRRVADGGTGLKVRLVKGANLAMEHVEAELAGLHPPTYPTKADVDANYLALVTYALSAGPVLRVGVASHNLYHVAFALDVAETLHARERLDIEMLEGMAPAEARVLARSAQCPVITYAPVTDPGDFSAAIAYLVRRLDENTSPDNYLSAAFFVDTDSERATTTRAAQRERFLAALASMSSVSRERRRRPLGDEGREFANSTDGDVTDPLFVERLRDELATFEPTQFARRVLLPGDVAGVDPSSGSEIYRYRRVRLEEAHDVLDALRRAQSSWASRSFEERSAVLNAFAQLAEEERVTTMAVMAHDTGKTPGESNAEVSEAADFAREYARYRDDAQPLGVITVTPPWNFPYAIPAGGVLAALAAGNAVVLKPAPEAVLVAAHLADQLWRSGVPRDVFAFVPAGDDEVGQSLVEGADGVILTGSLASAALFTTWRPRLHLLAETSGKNAIVVSARADIDAAARDIAASAFSHAGQKCSAGSLAVITRDVARDEAFWRQLVDAVESYEVGRAYEPGSHVGPVIHPPSGELARALDGLEPGEEWVLRPRALNEARTLWRPGIKRGTTPGSWSHLTEWFGPVLAVIEVADVAHALEVQNGTRFGLTAGLHSLDAEEICWWLDRVRAGNLYVNRPITGAVVHRQPFGGWRASALGVGPQAGQRGYVGALRRGDPVRVASDLETLVEGVRTWMSREGRELHDTDSLEGEWNLHRAQPFDLVVVRVEEPSGLLLDSLELLQREMGIPLELSASTPLDTNLALRIEGVDDMLERVERDWRVRWLSSEEPPTAALAERGVAVDGREIERAGEREAPRWWRSQSISITRHRYGNVHAGPQLVVEGSRVAPRR